MRKAGLFLFVLLLVFFAGCGAETTASAENSKESIADEVSVYMPEESSTYITESGETQNISAGIYYANTNSKKFHLDTCPSSHTIKNENLYITENREELINSGYVPCKNCNP